MSGSSENPSHTNPSHNPDAVGEWLAEANQDFFQRPNEPISSEAVLHALVGFIVFAIGVGLITWQVLSVT